MNCRWHNAQTLDLQLVPFSIKSVSNTTIHKQRNAAQMFNGFDEKKKETDQK